MDAAERRQLQEAMTRLADGDRAAFHPVFQLTWPLVARFVGSVLKRDADADDVAQQSLLRLFERAAEFDSRRDALPWILAIAWNECRTFRRRAGRRREQGLEAVRDLPAPGPDPEERALAADLTAAVRRTLASLPPADIETILADLAGPETRPAVPPGTFRKRLERARRRLREAWSARHGD